MSGRTCPDGSQRPAAHIYEQPNLPDDRVFSNVARDKSNMAEGLAYAPTSPESPNGNGGDGFTNFETVRRSLKSKTRKKIEKLWALTVLSASLFSLACNPLHARNFEDGLEAYRQGDYEQAREVLLPLSLKGDVRAIYGIGIMYFLGRGFDKNYSEASDYFFLAAREGHGNAQNYLGVMHRIGLGVPQNFVCAHVWYNLSGSQGIGDAAVNRHNLEKEMSAQSIRQAEQIATTCKFSDFADCACMP